jgi:DNA-3-methyladenine glycosylase
VPDRPPRSFFQRDAVTLARALLGQRLVRIDHGRRLAGTIVEVEAYLGVIDQAAHTYNGRRTPRNEAMYGKGGTAYVYFTYGLHHCLNVVAQSHDHPEAVLLRAIEPTEGLEVMRPRRAAARRDADLCSGPAKLCQALRIDRALNGVDLRSGDALFLEQTRRRALPGRQIAVGPRVGIDYAGAWRDKPLRFWVRGNPHVSRR